MCSWYAPHWNHNPRVSGDFGRGDFRKSQNVAIELAGVWLTSDGTSDLHMVNAEKLKRQPYPLLGVFCVLTRHRWGRATPLLRTPR